MSKAEEVAAAVALRALVDAYARAADAQDTDAFVALFAADARLSVYQPGADDPVAVLAGPDGLANAIAPLRAYRATLHVMANHTWRLDGADAAVGETYCLAHHVRPGGATEVEDLVMMIRYEDRYALADQRWRFAARGVHILWTEVRPASLDPIPF